MVMEDTTVDIIPTMDMVTPITVTVATGEDVIPTTEAPTGPDTIMVSIMAIIMEAVTIMVLILTDMVGWPAGIQPDMQGGQM